MKERLEIKQAEQPAWLTAALASHPNSGGAVFMRDERLRHFEQFSRRGLPTRREENWKYNDLSFLQADFAWSPAAQDLAFSAELQDVLARRAQDSFLLVFINGHYAPQCSALAGLPKGVILGSMREALEKHATLMSAYLLKEIDAHRYPFASLNAALYADGLFAYVPPGTVLEKPVHVLSLALGQSGFMTQPRHLVILENDALLTLTEEYRFEAAARYLTNVSLDAYVGRSASLNYYKLQNEAPDARHLANLFFHQKQRSTVNACSFAVGGGFTRNDLTLLLQEPYAACRANGFYGLDANGQVIDNHVHVEHAAKHTQSAMDYRGVLGGQSRGVFNGKVRVRPEAKKTESRQFNHNLLLSPLAEIDSKPELEIYADEVQCRHGATTGRLDEESLFYLRARGIEPQTARIILLQAFIEAVLTDVTLPWVKEAMHELWGRHLDKL